MTLLAGVDLGTTTVAGALVDVERGQVRHVARRANDARLASALGTRAEQDPERILSLALDVLRELAAAGGRVEGIALTGQMHGVLATDAGARPVTPLVTWQDRRTAEPLPGGETTLERLRARVADLDWRRNGCRIHAGYGAATLFWWAQERTLPPGTRTVCDVASWVAAWLTGAPPGIDPTFAASWGVYDLVDGGWNISLVDRLGFDPRLLPRVQPAGARLGALAAEAAGRVGLAAGLPVYNPVGDNQASFVGAATLASGGRAEETAVINLGTGGQVSWAVPGFDPPSETVETRPLPREGYLRVGASLCGGGAYAWLARSLQSWLGEFGLQVDQEAVLHKLNELAAVEVDPGSLQVRPTFLGVRGAPEVQGGAIESIPFETMRLGALARATLVGIVDELYQLYAQHDGPPAGAKRLIAAGGAVERNPLMMRLIEERFGLPTLRGEQGAAGAAGAAHVVAALGRQRPGSG